MKKNEKCLEIDLTFWKSTPLEFLVFFEKNKKCLESSDLARKLIRKTFENFTSHKLLFIILKKTKSANRQMADTGRDFCAKRIFFCFFLFSAAVKKWIHPTTHLVEWLVFFSNSHLVYRNRFFYCPTSLVVCAPCSWKALHCIRIKWDRYVTGQLAHNVLWLNVGRGKHHLELDKE